MLVQASKAYSNILPASSLPPMPPRIPLPTSSTTRRFGRYAVGLALWSPALIFFSDHVAALHRVRGRSMSPTLSPHANDRDLVLVKRWGAAEELERGQVVCFRSPYDPERVAIKRIIGIEGDVIRARPPYPSSLVTIPKGQIWVEGDEQFHSMDSNEYGPIPISLVTARVSYILLPLQRAGAVPADERPTRRGALVHRAPIDRPRVGHRYGQFSAQPAPAPVGAVDVEESLR